MIPFIALMMEAVLHRLHGAVSQKAIIFILVTVRTGNLFSFRQAQFCKNVFSTSQSVFRVVYIVLLIWLA
jgi:hypothetical protein